MKTQFEIKEKLPEIIAEIMHSDKWQTKILEKMHGLERMTIKDHPTVVYDEYIKEGMPMPSPYGDSRQSK